MNQIRLRDEKCEEIREFMQKTVALKEKQEDFDLFFNTISPSLINRVKSDIFEDKLVLNNTINRALLHFKLKSIKDLRKQKMLLPSGKKKKNNDCIKRLLFQRIPIEEDEAFANDKQLLQAITDKMGTLFAGPEETIVKQGDENADRIFFIVQGDCTVDMMDHDRKERHAFKLLVEGNMFGEISLLYNCPRTASIISKNYNTMGSIVESKLKDLLGEYPELKIMLEKNVFTYNEPKKNFYFQNLLKVDYFKGISLQNFHKLFFRFEPITLDPGDVLLYEGDDTNQLFVVEKGLLEMYVELDNHEFVLEYLRPGSVLNHTVVFMTDPMFVNIRAVETSYVSYILEADLDQLKEEDKVFDKRIS